MTKQDYDKIKSFCKKKLIKNLHARHLEDVTQHVAMEFFRHKEKGSWEWYFNDYCRLNGLSKRAKIGSMAIENATMVGEETWLMEKSEKQEEEIDNGFLFQMDNFLKKLNLPTRTLQWAMNIQKQRLSGVKTK